MGKIIQFPRQKPGRKWSPTEILAIKEPLDSREITRQERSRIASVNKTASEVGRRDRKRANRKKTADILENNQQYTVAVLTRLVRERTGQNISPATVTELLKELEAGGQAFNAGRFWWKSNPRVRATIKEN